MPAIIEDVLMKWILVFIVVKFNSGYYAEAVMADEFDNMVDCFKARELLLAKVVGDNTQSPYFPPNTQAICIRVEE